MGKVINIDHAIGSVSDGSVIAVSGFNMALTPEYLLIRLYERYKETGHPRDLFIIGETLPAVRERGLDLIARDMYERKDFGFIRGFMMPFLSFAPWVQRLVIDNVVEAYTMPIGIAARWFRCIASGTPLITKVGLGTFLDPREDGIYMNSLARERKTCGVEIVNLNGDEYLLYNCPKPNIGLIRGAMADERGNLVMSNEAIYGSVLAIAQAVKAQPSPGIVIAQVLYVAKYVSPKEVHVPGPLIDYVVISPPEYHRVSASVGFDDRVCGRVVPSNVCLPSDDGKLDIELAIARRVTLELVGLLERLGRPLIINLGIGIPALVAKVIRKEGIEDVINLTVESGPWGGVALSDEDFGVALAPEAILPMPDQFLLYEGGIIDAASLGFMQVDFRGNVNPSFLPERITGPGGFPVIVHGAPRIYFAGAFTAGQRNIRVINGKLAIIRDGGIIKFVRKPYKVGFNAELGLKMGKEVLYITERAVFRLTSEGLVLEEYAPGVDIERDILNKMEFKPKISRGIKPMPEEVFKEGRMGLRDVIMKVIKQ